MHKICSLRCDLQTLHVLSSFIHLLFKKALHSSCRVMVSLCGQLLICCRALLQTVWIELRLVSISQASNMTSLTSLVPCHLSFLLQSIPSYRVPALLACLFPSEFGTSMCCLSKSSQGLISAGSCIEAVSSELTFFTLPNCFELFGFDFLVGEDWNVWLLEVSSQILGLQRVSEPWERPLTAN